MSKFRYETAIPYPRPDVFEWFTRPGALVRLTPSFFGSTLAEPSDGINVGSRAALGVGAPGNIGMWLGTAAGSVRGLLPASLAGKKWTRPELRWDALHTELTPGTSFTDVMDKGPLAAWTHKHSFVDGAQPGTTVTVDEVDYELPAVARNAWAQKKMDAELTAMFAFRERTLLADLAFHANYSSAPLTIAVSGASGLIGRQVCALLGGGGHTVVKLVRGAPKSSDEIFWDPDAGVLDSAGLARAQVVIHLAGHPIGGRFTDEVKDAIYQSRVRGTTLVAQTLADIASDGVERTLVCGSAVGYYGSDPHAGVASAQDGTPRPLVESDPAGTDFLARVCRDWEASCAPAVKAGVRVANVRTGLVLSAAGGVLQRLLPLYLAGAGGPVGGEQWQSWVGIDDIAGIFVHAALTPQLSGPLNGVAPQPVTAREFARTLGAVLHRPAKLKVPALAPRLLLGDQGANELALASQRVSAAKIQESGYTFRHNDLESALRHILGK
ncbi:TIGR01777 family oxidoreductase [Arthrobacter antibioticus]|uniref:TIGR01777 family oxidoreductase n=1 Tax=Arthrobacter sp. H35-MC1 TaxID=3046203 RepID=UPI0024B891F0|nr:TIGR01777 family oxidoreductase [Arthrobacter sp. H35-MC1]MDJ0316607.1 TIGR01777 family oxidoreductase [Arthrobacter sp. H35-MC1]